MQVGIVGGGPAGLTAALAAAALGLAPTVFEQTPDLRRLGGGIAIQPNGLRVLDALGLLAGLRARMHPIGRIVLQRAGGRTLACFDYRDLPLVHRQVAILLRSELQEYLLVATTRRGIPVRFGSRCIGVTPTGRGAVLRFASGADHECDVVVGADGVHSVLRALVGVRARLRALGWAALRGTVDVPCDASVAREIWGPDGRLFGIVPLPEARTYFYCSAPVGRWAAIVAGSLDDWIAGWDVYGRDVSAILRKVSDWGTVNYDEIREVSVKPWYRLPVFLIGDAAHAMAPNWGQGANSAMVDALLLMKLVARSHGERRTLDDVGRRYETIRRRFVSLLQTGSLISGTMPTRVSRFERWLCDASLGLQDRIPWLRNRVMQMVAGSNPKEEAWLRDDRGGAPASAP